MKKLITATLITLAVNVNAGQTATSNQQIVNAWSQQNDTTRINENSFNGSTRNRTNTNNSQQNQIADSYNRVNVNSNNTTTSTANDSYNSNNYADGGNAYSDSYSYSEGSYSDSYSYSEGSTSDSNANATVGDASSVSGGNTLSTGATKVSTSYENNVMTFEAMQFETAYDTIGSVSKARTTLRAEAGHSEAMGNMVRVGVNIPLTWGSNPTDEALKHEAERIKFDNIRQQETHEAKLKEYKQKYTQVQIETTQQAELHEAYMFEMCMELHTLGRFASDTGSVLSKRCSQYVPHNDSKHNSDGHNGHNHRLQVSSHK